MEEMARLALPATSRSFSDCNDTYNDDRPMNVPPTEPVSVGPGQVLGGKYRVERIIGSGGMGIVVSARHVTMNHRVAIKILNLDEDADREDAIARFQREARAAARIESDHVVRVTDVAALDDGTPYMVMDYLEGEDLRRVIVDRDQLPVAEAVGYILEACEGLSEAHAAGVVHRDLKPSNLFLARKANGTKLVKVLDFGISKVAPRAGEAAITTTNMLMGSPMYMAPEQMRSSRDVDSRADIWSLGLILYELLSGEVPFRGETIPEICVAVMSGEPEPMAHFRTDVPAELQDILAKCLAKDRAKRYPTMAALARDLVRFADAGARVHADRASAALKAARAASDPPPTGESSDRDATRVAPSSRRDPQTLKSWSTGAKNVGGSRRTVWVVLATIVCAVALGVGVKLAHVSPGVAPIVAAPRAPIAPSATIAPDPTPPSVVLPSVPFDSLPLAARDAGTSRAPRTSPPTVAQTPNVPSASSATPPPKKDDWKWGDRN